MDNTTIELVPTQSPLNDSTPLITVFDILLVTFFLVGCVGNVVALCILSRSNGGGGRPRNSRHTLMLRCLATNDLLAEVGMLTLMYLQRSVFHSGSKYCLCVLYVIVRAFGLGSGCVALVMAVERWLALTRPFSYQQHITYVVIKRTIFGLWIVAAVLTYAPFMGFGLFYSDGECFRYREATLPIDVAYAYIFLLFGSILCVCIVCCNSLVFCGLAHVGHNRNKAMLIRRMSRAIINNTTQRYSTKDELAFAKLMAFLNIMFVVCWLPQMISIPLAQFYGSTMFYEIFGRLADVLMCVYFTMDPYVYVIHRYVQMGTTCCGIQPHNWQPVTSGRVVQQVPQGSAKLSSSTNAERPGIVITAAPSLPAESRRNSDSGVVAVASM